MHLNYKANLLRDKPIKIPFNETDPPILYRFYDYNIVCNKGHCFNDNNKIVINTHENILKCP